MIKIFLCNLYYCINKSQCEVVYVTFIDRKNSIIPSRFFLIGTVFIFVMVVRTFEIKIGTMCEIYKQVSVGINFVH